MNKIFILILLINLSALSQQERRYFDTPFGGGGGYTPGWYLPNLDPINQRLNPEMFIPEAEIINMPQLTTSGIYSSGGAGFIYLGIVPNLRIGGMGFGGGTSSKSNSGGESREVKYKFGGGGLTLEYTLPFIKRIGVSFGTIIGAASQTIELYKNRGQFSWDDIWAGMGSGHETDDYSRIMENNYWILTPTLNIDIPFYRFFLFRIGAGYNYSLGNKWEIENDRSLSGVPDELNGSSFFIQSGIFIGFFSF
jgi:hypothetical protein